MATGKPWSRDDLLVAMHLYCQIPFGQFHARNHVLVDVAVRMGRTSGSLAMKLCNLASFDPAHRLRGVRGLRGASHADEAIWNEFAANWDAMVDASANAMASLAPHDAQPFVSEPQIPWDRPTTATATVTVRRGQDFFRTTVLTAHGRRCCMSGCDVPDLLVASHIVPWSVDPTQRLNPHNGLCLAALHDRAFDLGYLGLDDGLHVLVSPRLRRHTENPAVRTSLLALEGVRITLPERFAPDLGLVRRHREEVFASSGGTHSR